MKRFVCLVLTAVMLMSIAVSASASSEDVSRTLTFEELMQAYCITQGVENPYVYVDTDEKTEYLMNAGQSITLYKTREAIELLSMSCETAMEQLFEQEIMLIFGSFYNESFSLDEQTDKAVEIYTQLSEKTDQCDEKHFCEHSVQYEDIIFTLKRGAWDGTVCESSLLTIERNSVSQEDFSVLACYPYNGSRGDKNYAAFVIKNNVLTDTVRLNVTVLFYDENDRLIGAKNSDMYGIESGQVFEVTALSDLPYARAECQITYAEDKVNRGLASQIVYESNVVGQKMILSAKNTSEYDAESARYILLFVKDEIVIQYEAGYIENVDGLKVEETAYREIPIKAEYDECMIFIEAYGDK